jgi:ABC-type glutathione transport system ATPase component
MDPFIALDDVSMLYGNNGTHAAALRGVSFSVAGGEYVAVTGESGAGHPEVW